MGLIKMNYYEVRAEADRLADLARQGEQFKREVGNIAESMPSIWTGESGTAFTGVCGQWGHQMDHLVKTLYDISRNLRVIADEMEAAEKRVRSAIRS